MMDDARQVRIARIQLMGLGIALVVEFILGITLSTVIDFAPGKNDATQAGFLVAHVVVGAGLVIAGIARLVLAFRSRTLPLISGLGLLCVIGALVTGAVSADNGSTVMTFLMGLFFVAALVIYAYGLLIVSRAPR